MQEFIMQFVIQEFVMQEFVMLFVLQEFVMLFVLQEFVMQFVMKEFVMLNKGSLDQHRRCVCTLGIVNLDLTSCFKKFHIFVIRCCTRFVARIFVIMCCTIFVIMCC